MGGFDLDGTDDGYEDFEDRLGDDDLDQAHEEMAMQHEDCLDGVTPDDTSDLSDQGHGSEIDIEELGEGDTTSSRSSSHRRGGSARSSSHSTPQDDSRYGVESAQDYIQRQERLQRSRGQHSQMISARQAAMMRERLSAGRRARHRRPSNLSQSDSEADIDRSNERARNSGIRQFLTRAMIEDVDTTTPLEEILLAITEPTMSANESSNESMTPITIPPTPGGWSTDDEDNDDNMTSEENEEDKDAKDTEAIAELYPDAIPRPFTSRNLRLRREEPTVKTECICKTLNHAAVQCTCPAGNDFPDQLVILTTGRNLYLMDPKQRLKKIAVDKNILADIDLRTDRMLCIMDRLNMTEVRGPSWFL
jgi:hypothetical protein